MGQKTHPNGFRLITTQKHLSEWYTNKFNYSSLINEDYFIRSKIEEFFKDILLLSKIEINRITQEDNTNEYIGITIYSLFPREKEMSRKINKYVNQNGNEKKNETSFSLEKKETNLNFTKPVGIQINSKENLKVVTSFMIKRYIRNLIRFLQLKINKNFYIDIKFIRNPFEDSILIAKFIADQLEKRIPFRRIVKATIKKVQRTKMKGIKIQVSGRLNGIDIARSEWKRDGKIPLHTLKAKIDYTYQMAETVYGVIGIKVWLFSGNI